MGGLSGFAAEVRAMAERAQSSLALEACRMGAREYLAVLQEETPVRSGKLRGSEHVWRVEGGGASATAILGPNVRYDKFRNYGGTIHVRRAKVLTDGATFFGKEVTQKGSHYMEKARGPGRAALARACAAVAAEYLHL